MRKIACSLFIVLCILSGRVLHAKERVEIVVSAPVVEAQLFKNGIAMVTQMFHADAAGGTYVVQPAPKPIHGTFWFHGDTINSARFSKKEIVKKPDTLNQEMLLEQLAGKRVELLTNNNSVKGTIVRVEEKSNSNSNYVYSFDSRSSDNNNIARYVLIETSSGFQYVSTSSIWAVKLEDDKIPLEISVLEPAMVVSIKPAKNDQNIYFSYLTNGLAWAPAYRLELLDDKTGRLSMSGALKNEFMDMSDVQFHLISGFPNIQFKHVTSPLWPDTNLNDFFSQLAQEPSSRVPAAMTQMVMSNASFSYYPQENTTADVTQLYSGDFDLHFQDAGQHTILMGESLLIPVATQKLDYKKILLWEIPDDRDAYGRMIDLWRRYYDGQDDRETKMIQEDVWDSIEMKNPFDFPMTTAPVAVYDRNGYFNGQTMTFWNAPNEKMYVKVTKALNMRVRHTEVEVPSSRSTERLLGYKCYKTQIEGKLFVHNLRNKNALVRITKRFSGTKIKAEENPEITLLPEGVFNINERNEVVWNLNLKPGEDKVITYSYWTYMIICYSC